MIDVKGENPKHVSSTQKSAHCLILTLFPFVTQMDKVLRSKTTLQENTVKSKSPQNTIKGKKRIQSAIL